MKRRDFIAGFSGAVAWPVSARAQQRGPSSVPVLLLLAQVSPVNSFAGVRQYLAELDYTEGRIVIHEQIGSLSELSAELARRRVDIIHAVSPAAIRTAWAVPNNIPIVGFDYETDPLRSGFVKSIARPGGKLTGVFLDQPGLGGKWLQLLHEVVPTLSHVAVLWEVETGTSQLEAVRQAAAKLGIRVDVYEFDPDLERVFRAISATSARALILLSSPSVANQSDRLAKLAWNARLPSISLFRHFAQWGGLLSYGPDGPEMRRRAAAMIDKILRGSQPAEIPVEGPTRFELIVNLKTATALGLSIPLALQTQAEVIE